MPAQQTADTHVKAVNLKMREDTRALIDRAAQMQGRSRTDFMIEASRRAAEDAILDQTVISVDAKTYGRFLSMLDAPPQPNDKLRKTMQTKAPWEPQ
ncbi:CopG family transcriptional regulator [Sphingobium sp. SCG-1]|uniref:type II toxin-antitoxin system TacA family antitoxin n=1 Tax=Sphingobium sp. SCG-1 TaxID=2072936 RepID=UPI000CD6A037|nr:DUF1778 domain-containing protein [Sphingobium sp. SCG-1]AUW58051.1 CopG family transcriptional regulator [Sphingobium sp. SCG-1]